MARQRRQSKTKSNRQLKKALNNTTREQRQMSTKKGTAAIEAVRRLKDALKPYELTQMTRFQTYQRMLADSAVWSSWESRKILTQEAVANGKFKYDKTNTKSKEIVAYLEYCMSSMSGQTLRSVAGQAEDGVYNSFAPFEVVTTEGDGEFLGYRTLKNLVYIDPLTLDRGFPFSTKNDGHEVDQWRQSATAFRDTARFGTTLNFTNGIKEIDARKVAVTYFGGSQMAPIVTSCFDAAYDPWREKCLINEILLVGVQKDMAGMPIFEAPQQFFDDAAEVGSDAYYAMEAIKEQLADLHNGAQSFMFFPSDTHSETGQGAKQYNLSFKGVDGGGKSFTLDELITQKNQAIHKAIGALNLNSAEQGSASYNSLEGQTNLQFHYVKSDCRNFDEMINKQVIPLLLKLNSDKFGDYKVSDIPVWKHGEVQELSVKEFGKYVQQVKLYLPRTPEVVNRILEVGGFDYNINESMPVEELSEMMPEFDSRDRSGESGGTSGFGDKEQNLTTEDTQE